MGKHLDFYYKYMQEGRLPFNGLCGCAMECLIDNEILKLVAPTDEDFETLRSSGFIAIANGGYWGSGTLLHNNETEPDERVRAFSSLRQTIVLFMAALN